MYVIAGGLIFFATSVGFVVFISDSSINAASSFGGGGTVLICTVTEGVCSKLIIRA